MSLPTPQMPAGSSVVESPAKKSPQFLLALVTIVALEAVFAAMARLGDLSIHLPEFMALALGGGVLYCVGLYAIEHTRDDRAVLWLVLLGGLAFRLTLFPHPPSLSTDLYRYRWDGHVQSAGWNPYAVAPMDPRLAPLRDPGWYVMPVPEIPTMYPPLAQLVFRATWRLFPDPVWFKLPFLLADLAVAAMLAGWIRSTGGRNYQVAIYAWNPLVVVEFASSGHNDALALAGVVASLLIIRRSAPLSTLTLTAGALAKAFPVVLLPLALFRAGWPGKLRGWLAAGGCAALAAACAWPYRHGWREFLAMLHAYQLIFRNYHSSIYPVLLWLYGSHEIAAGVGEGVVIGLALWLAIRSADPTRAAFLLIGTLLLFAPNGYSWYFTWIVPLLCFFPSPAWLLLTILEFLSYKIFINYRALGVWHFDPLFQWLCYAPFYALLGWELVRERASEKSLTTIGNRNATKHS
ncbi:MAG TPA: glycosyltransferase 87 family protein [Candidatus Sulfotelmatobacter sp.]|nr:glycosyltransferase 87 family protein [Candidatus Sulfotelmatobacter sp.]